MPSLKMSLGLIIRSKYNWVQNNTKYINNSSSDHMIPIKFTETIQDLLQIHDAFNTQPRQELSICPCKIKCHLSANFAKSKYVMVMLNFCQYHNHPIIQNYKKTHVNG